MGAVAVNNRQNAVRHLEIMCVTIIGVVPPGQSSVQHTVDFETLRLSSEGSPYNVPGVFKWGIADVRLAVCFSE